jgi:O-antigen ligase
MTVSPRLAVPVAARARSVSPRPGRFRGLLLIGWILAMPVTQAIEFGGKNVNLAASDVLLPLGVCFLIWRALQNRLRLPLLALCCLSILAIDLSILANLNNMLASKGAISIAIEMVKVQSLWLQFYVIVNLVDSRVAFRNALRTWLAGSILVALIGIYGSLSYQMTGIENQYALQFRAEGTLGDSNLFGDYLGLSVLLGILLWQLDRPARKWIVFGIASQLAGMFLSASRGTMLSFTTVLLLLVTLSVSWKTRLISLGSLTAVVVGLAAMPGLQSWLASNPFTERLATATVDINDDNASDRKQLWHDAMIYFQKSPFVGIGRGNFRLLDQADLSETGAVHSMFIGLACETGIFGAIVYLFTFGFYPFTMAMDRLTMGEPFPLSTRLMLCALLMLMLSGLTISLENFRGLWIVLGLMEAYRRIFGTYSMSFPRGERA